MVDIEYLTRKYFTFDKPVEYVLRKDEQIEIYPILVKDWVIFEECYDIFNYDKNSSGVVEIIQMSYLQFLMEVIGENDELVFNKLYNILQICCKTENIQYGIDESGKYFLAIDNKIITSHHFDDIKKIILFQNIVNYDDTEISADIKKIIDDYNRLSSGDVANPTLETKLSYVGNECGLQKKDMLEMTYREFDNRFNLAIELMGYHINKMAEAQGCTFKEKLEHPIYRKIKNKFSQFFSDSNTVKKTIEGANN